MIPLRRLSRIATAFIALLILAGSARALDVPPPPDTGDKNTKNLLLVITIVAGAIFIYLKIRSSKDVNADLSTALREAKERALREAGKKPD